MIFECQCDFYFRLSEQICAAIYVVASRSEHNIHIRRDQTLSNVIDKTVRHI